MRTVVCLILAATGAVSAQERVYIFNHSETAQQMQEVTTVMRNIAEIHDVTLDEAARTATFRGNPAQLGTADFLFDEIATPTQREHRVSGIDDDIVRVFRLEDTQTIADFQEMATMIRSVAEIRRVFTYNQPRAMAIRGTKAQVAFTEWITEQLSRPEAAYPRTVNFGGDANDVASLLRVPDITTVADFQEAAVSLRRIGEIRRLFTYNSARLIVIRGTPSEAALGTWLSAELNRAAERRAPVEPYRIAGADDAVNLYYLPANASLTEFQETSRRVSAGARVRTAVTYSRPHALILRGSLGQLAAAQQMIQMQKTQ